MSFFFYELSLGMIGVDEKLPYGIICGVVYIKELNGEPELYGLLTLCMRCFADV